tara:strand:+ start:2449 stop:3051 length:603 start_codon:yes stop_codon:yes gene_type:complete
MIEIDVFPKTFFGLEVPEEINERVLGIVKKLNYSYDEAPHPLSTNTDIHKLPELNFYVDYLNKNLEEIKQKQNWVCDKISICSMWANNTTYGRSNSRHNHPMSWWSFIHYLTEGTPTHFFDHHTENPWMYMGESNPTTATFHPGVSLPVGSILFFPSWVPHQVDPNRDHISRYTIAGNTFPEGDIDPRSGRSHLKVKLCT